ncbi:hypothetical protein B0O99DRAFT_600351 [Bisporella sp. PMI_857]|nr:hypothetical protein B0O99DRAFT_600351 [Bisporella sp. PMI_857]
MSKEKVTYITYNEGVDAKHLHLGNLVHDYNHPIYLEPYVEKAYADVSELPPSWVRSATLQDYALTLGSTSSDGTKPRYQIAAAAKATKLEIKDPNKFFNEVTLKSEKATKWLASRLSAAEELKQLKPQIWILTGLILMTHATWTSLSSDQTFTPGQQAPFNPSGVSAIRRLSVSEDVKPAFGFRANAEEHHVSGSVIHETGKYPGTRAWAAQWQLVDVEVRSGKAQDGAANQIKLRDGAKVAVVELQSGSYADGSKLQAAEDSNDELWDALLDKAEDYV